MFTSEAINSIILNTRYLQGKAAAKPASKAVKAPAKPKAAAKPKTAPKASSSKKAAVDPSEDEEDNGMDVDDDEVPSMRPKATAAATNGKKKSASETYTKVGYCS
jgi:DNA topoisomerase-2